MVDTGIPPSKPRMQVFPEPVVGALIVRRDKVLLLKSPKWKGYWTTAGGHIELGETAGAALKRELREELGIGVSIKRVLAVQEVIYTPLFWKRRHFIFMDFLCEAKSFDVKMDGTEITAYRWVDSKGALKMKLEPYFMRLLKAYLVGGTPFYIGTE